MLVSIYMFLLCNNLLTKFTLLSTGVSCPGTHAGELISVFMPLGQAPWDRWVSWLSTASSHEEPLLFPGAITTSSEGWVLAGSWVPGGTLGPCRCAHLDWAGKASCLLHRLTRGIFPLLVFHCPTSLHLQTTGSKIKLLRI